MSTIKKRSKPRESVGRDELRRPFERDVLRRARDIAARYQIVVRFADGEFYGEGLELPGVAADGKTADACVKAVREALIAAVATLIEQGHDPPAPAGESRTEQVNVRLSPREKLRLESAAANKGFRGIADYMRATVLKR